MARVNYVKKARASKRPRRCEKCRTEIKVGDPYKWFANRIGRSSMRHDYCSSCVIRPSDMTTSPHLSSLYSATEAADDALDEIGDGGLEGIAAIVTECAGSVREVSEGYGESADNIEEGFGHETSQSEEIRGKSDELENFAQELESAADEIEGMDDPDEVDEIRSEFEQEYDDDDDAPDEDSDEEAPDPEADKDGNYASEDKQNAWNEYLAEKQDERREAAVDAARDALSNCPM